MSKNKPESTSPRIQWPTDLAAQHSAEGSLASPPLLPQESHRSQVPTDVSRRRLLQLLGAAAIAGGVASVSGTPTGANAAGASAASTLAQTGAHRSTGTIKDVKHVVVLMQENRSFDHYYGTLAGVRGFSDKQGLELPSGSVFEQPDESRPDGGALLPFHMDSAKYNAQNAGGLDHSWSGGHKAWNNGAWNRWVDAKSPQTMGYFTRDDLPYHYALADAFTICDHYFCSVTGPTTPNRLYQWSGTVNAAGGLGGPATSNPADYAGVYSWGTYGEELQKAGVSWKTYANDEVGDSGAHPYVGDYGDNPLWLFKQYHEALASSDPAVRQLALNGGLHDGWKPDSGKGLDVNYLLRDFGADCAAGTLPQVSYVVAPYGWCEHPAASPDYGAHFTNAVVQAVMSNDETWRNTVLLINFDENDGYFDHVVPPIPEPGTPDEFVQGLPVGYGVRVPMTVVSPWSRGGYVSSQVFDHTSVIRFLEAVTGVQDHNISAWRRNISGDLTSSLDFRRPDYSKPQLPDTLPLLAAADADRAKPPVVVPLPGQQHLPAQEKPAPARRLRPVPYAQNAWVAVDEKAGKVVATLKNDGAVAVSMAVYPNVALPFAATPFDVAAGAPREYTWDLGATDGKYDFSVYGPDRFVRRFAGSVSAAQPADGAGADGANGTSPRRSRGPHAQVEPEVRLSFCGDREVEFELVSGSGPVTFKLQAHDFVQRNESVALSGGSRRARWPLASGYYDVVVSSDQFPQWSRRFAGRVG